MSSGTHILQIDRLCILPKRREDISAVKRGKENK